MPAPFLSAFELHSKTNIPLFVLQAAIDMGCHCYSSANGAAIERIDAAPSPNIIDLNEYKDRFEEEKAKAIHKSAYIYFKIDELFFYVQREFGEDTALAFWHCLDNIPTAPEIQSTSVISSPPAGSSPAQALAELERKLDEARRREEVLMARVAKSETDQGTSRATIGKLKKQAQTLAAGYEGAAKLACEIRRLGPRTSGNPWSEDEILALADELSVSIKGDCLKAFKAGMPDDLVKKSPGARPTTPHDESPDNEGS